MDVNSLPDGWTIHPPEGHDHYATLRWHCYQCGEVGDLPHFPELALRAWIENSDEENSGEWLSQVTRWLGTQTYDTWLMLIAFCKGGAIPCSNRCGS